MRRHRSASIYAAAWCGIDATSLKAGETVLLIGAGGGVGAAAAQIARRGFVTSPCGERQDTAPQGMVRPLRPPSATCP
jgi:NADPH:quinone reductase-like Zn-dependent oxidoreductase